MEHSNIPFIVQSQINNAIKEQNVQDVSLNTQNENVKDIAFSNSGDNKIKIRPEAPKVSYKIIMIDNSKVGIQLSAIPSLHDEIGSVRQIIDDTYSIIRDGKIIKEGLKPTLDFTDTDIKYGQIYNYIVRVISTDGSFNNSSQISISTIDTTIPHLPYDFEVLADGVSDIQNGRATVRFIQNNDQDYQGMRILIKQSDLSITEWKETKFVPKVEAELLLDGSYVRASISGLIPNKFYDFAIQAKDYFGNLSEMKIITNKRLEDNVSPNPPKNIIATNISTDLTSKTYVRWDIPSDRFGILDIAGYKIERYLSTDPTSSTVISTINSKDIISYEDITVSAGNKYVYKIRAFDETGNYSDYAYSNEIYVSLNTISASMTVSHDISGENTLPVTISVSSSIEAQGFLVSIKENSTGNIIANKRYVGNAPFSIKIEYKDLSDIFLQSIANNIFPSNGFTASLYKTGDQDKHDLLVSQAFTLDLTPSTVSNFSVLYDPKIKKLSFSWDKQSLSIIDGYEIRYAGKITQKTWANSTILTSTDKDTNSIVCDLPSDISLSDPQTTTYFHIKAKSRILQSSFNPPKQTPFMHSKTESSNSVVVYGKLPAITGMVVTGDVQSVIIKFTPLDTSVYKGVKEYWIYASYTQSDLDNPTAQMIAWKGQASMPVINRMPNGDLIPNEVKTIYFKMAAISFDGDIGTLSELFSGDTHDNTIPEFTVSFDPNILVDRLLPADNLTITLSAYDNSGFLATGALYSSIDDAAFVAKTYTLSNADKNLSYQETLYSLPIGQHKILFKIYDKYNNFITSQVYNFEVDNSTPAALPAPYIEKDNSFVQTMMTPLSAKTSTPLRMAKESIDIYNSKTVQVCLPEFTTCSNFSHIKLYVSQYDIATSSYGDYTEIKMPQSTSLGSVTSINNFKATITFDEDMYDFKIKAIQVKKNGISGDINLANASARNKIDTTAPLIKINSITYENDSTNENIANFNYINSRIVNGGLILDLNIIENNSGLWSNAIDYDKLRIPVYYQINGGTFEPLMQYGSSMFKSPFYIPKEKLTSISDGEKITITIYALDNALKLGTLVITKIMNKTAPGNVANYKGIFGVEANKGVIKVSYTKPSDSDLMAIRLYEAGILIKETFGEVMSIPDAIGNDRSFVLKSVDVAYNESSGVSFTAHNYAPKAVTNLVATQDINSIKLSFDKVLQDTNNDVMTDLKYYEVSYTKYNGTVVSKTSDENFVITLSKDEMNYYNTNYWESITDIKVRAIDFFGLAGSYSSSTTGRPRYIEAVDMKDNIFKFVATSNKFTGTFDYILDGNFKNSEYISSSVSKNDYIQIDMLKPDFISDIKVKFSSSSDVIRFIIGYLNVDQYGNKEWRYLSSDSTHSVAKIVTRTNSELETAHTNYIEVSIPDGTDNGGTYSVSMLRPSLTKETIYCSSIRLIFSSALSNVAVSEIQPKNRSIYNEFYGDILYLSTLATIRSSEDPTNYLTFDKEKILMVGNSEDKVKIGKLLDGTYGMWAKDNVYLGGTETEPQLKVNSTDIQIGRLSNGYYNTKMSSSGFQAGYISSLNDYNVLIAGYSFYLGNMGSNHYASVFGTGSIQMGYLPSIDDYMMILEFNDSSKKFSIRGTETGYPTFFEVGSFLAYNNGTQYTRNTAWSKSVTISDDKNAISYESVGSSLFVSKFSLTEVAVRIRGGYSGTQTVEQNLFELSATGSKTIGGYFSSEYTCIKAMSSSATGYGIFGYCSSNIGVYGETVSKNGIKGYGPNGALSGIWGDGAGTCDGVWGTSVDGNGGEFSSTSGYGVYTTSSNGHGLKALSGKSDGRGIWGEGSGYGVYGYGIGSGTGVYGYSYSGYGVRAATVSGDTSLKSDQKSDLTGDVNFGAQMYAANLSSGAGTYAVKWTSGTGQFTKDTSSIRYKHDLEELPFDMNLYNNIKTYKFKYNSDNSNDIGFIAEELSTLFPDIVIFDKEDRPDAVKYDRMAVYNVIANQHNNSEILLLKDRVSQLETLVDQLLNK